MSHQVPPTLSELSRTITMTGVSEHDLLLPNNTSSTTPCDNEFEELMTKSTLPNNVGCLCDIIIIVVTGTNISCITVIVTSCQFLTIIQSDIVSWVIFIITSHIAMSHIMCGGCYCQGNSYYGINYFKNINVLQTLPHKYIF